MTELRATTICKINCSTNTCGNITCPFIRLNLKCKVICFTWRSLNSFEPFNIDDYMICYTCWSKKKNIFCHNFTILTIFHEQFIICPVSRSSKEGPLMVIFWYSLFKRPCNVSDEKKTAMHLFVQNIANCHCCQTRRGFDVC